MAQISRRLFVTAAAGATAAPFVGRAKALGVGAPITARQIVDRIKARIGVEWRADTFDTFKAGDPETSVTGIVTTSMATLDVLRKAVQARANFVITAAPTFYSRADLSTPPTRGARGGRGQMPAGGAGGGMGMTSAAYPNGDPVYAGKNEFIGAQQLAIFRLNQHWNARTPDPRAEGLAKAMGWAKYRTGDDARRYDVPPIALGALASQLTKALGARGGIRAIGDPATTVRRIGLLPGYTLLQASIAMMPTVDVIVAGEVQEWESATYVQDVVFGGTRKGFISIGRVVNEAPGMQVCAEWLEAIVPDVPVRFIPAGDPYWRPR